MDRTPIPCSFSFDSGMPSIEKTTSLPQGLETSSISFGLWMHLQTIILCSSGNARQDSMAFSSAFAMTMENSPESTGSISGKERWVSRVAFKRTSLQYDTEFSDGIGPVYRVMYSRASETFSFSKRYATVWNLWRISCLSMRDCSAVSACFYNGKDPQKWLTQKPVFQ